MDNLQALTIDDFSGGMTDFIVGGSVRQNEIIKNMVIDENRDLITREGSRPKFNYRITTNEVPALIVPYNNEFLVQAESSLYLMGSSSATAINVVGESDAFIGAGTSTKVFQNFWNDNVVFTSSSRIYPLKCWKDSTDTFRLERLGLPYVLLGYLITLSNDLKSKFNAHIIDTGEHSSSDVGNAVTSANASDFDSLITLTNELLTQYELHLDASAKHPGSVSAADRLEERSIETIYGAATALADMKAKLNQHDDDGVSHSLGAANHQVTAKSTTSDLLSSAGGTGNSYLYAIHLKYTYSTDIKTFLENSDVLYAEISDVGTPDSNAITVNLPTISSLSEYNVSEIKVAIYRTKNGGQSFFKLDEVPLSQSTYVDSKSDTDIENNAPLYTEGGVLADEPPPKAKLSVMVGDTLVLGDIQDGARRYPNAIQYSKEGRPYSCPSDFRYYFEDDLIGLGYINTYPIVFLDNKVYRVEGGFDSFGKGFIRKRIISDSIGAVNQKSIVNTKIGVFFAGQDGFYFTDGFEAKRVSTDINHTYEALAHKQDIEGTYDKLNNRVKWACKRDSSNTYNDSIFVAHLDYQSEKNGNSFSFFDGGIDVNNFLISGIGFDYGNDTNNLLRLDPNGYLIYHDSSFNDDCFVNINKDPDEWDTQTIIYNIDTVAFDFNNPKTRKWVPKMNVNALNISALSLQISSSNDNRNQYVGLTKVIDQSNVTWGDPTVIWGDDSIYWNLLPIISRWRYFPAIYQAIRCMYKQLRFTNAYITIDSSDAIGNSSIASGSNTVTLLDSANYDWSSESVNYYISFAHESYAFEYKIIGISGADLTISDPANTLTDSSDTAWKINGYKKGEVLNLSNYVISYNPITMTQETVREAQA